MPVKIVISENRVQARLVGAWNTGLEKAAWEILADCNEYCKQDQGTLIMSSMIHSQFNKGRLIWDTPYAKRQYWEIKTSLTPGRTWKWCETAKKKHGDRWRRLTERAMRENL